MRAFAGRFAQDRKGATAIEYGLMAALIAVALITSLLTLREAIADGYGVVGDIFEDVNSD